MTLTKNGDLLRGLRKCTDDVERRHLHDCAIECSETHDYDECYNDCIAEYVEFECGVEHDGDAHGKSIEEELYEE